MKKTLTAIALTIVTTFGATFANAGIIVGDFANSCTTDQKQKEGIIVGDYTGIIVGDFTGIIVGDFVNQIKGIIVGDRVSTPCADTGKTGIIVGD